MSRLFEYSWFYHTRRNYRRVFDRILKWANKNKVSISEAQLDSVDFVYNDNAKGEDDE